MSPPTRPAAHPAAALAPGVATALLAALLGSFLVTAALAPSTAAQEPVDESQEAAEAAERTGSVDGGESATPGSDGAAEHVVLETDHGTMTLRLFPDEAPRTVAHFKRLVEEGFYDGQPFYRVVAGHVIQAGDGGENDQPTVPLEAGGHPHVEGAVGLARGSDPDSGSTEFYICLAPRPHLDGNYAVFGQLVDGFDVLREIGAVPVDEQWVGDDNQVAFHAPQEDVVIESARVVAAGEAGTASDGSDGADGGVDEGGVDEGGVDEGTGVDDGEDDPGRR